MEDNKKKKESATINIRLPKSDLDLIRKLAEEDGRTINNYICRIIRKYLDNYLEKSDNLD
jgi:predicted DNA binding CopG/RHH family protein